MLVWLVFLQEGGPPCREEPDLVVYLQSVVPGDGPVHPVPGTRYSTSGTTCSIHRQEVHRLLLRMLRKQSVCHLLLEVSDFHVFLLFFQSLRIQILFVWPIVPVSFLVTSVLGFKARVDPLTTIHYRLIDALTN